MRPNLYRHTQTQQPQEARPVINIGPSPMNILPPRPALTAGGDSGSLAQAIAYQAMMKEQEKQATTDDPWAGLRKTTGGPLTGLRNRFQGLFGLTK